MAPPGKLDVKEKGKVVVATFLEVAFLDETTIKELGQELENLVKERTPIHLIINFENVDYLSSAVLGRLVKVYKLVKKGKGKVKLCCIRKNIQQVFKITKLDKMFEIFPDEDKAVRSFKSFRLFGR